MSYTEIIEEIDELRFDEQVSIYNLLKDKIKDKNEEFIYEVKEGVKEYQRGEAKSGTVDDFMQEFLSWLNL